MKNSRVDFRNIISTYLKVEKAKAGCASSSCAPVKSPVNGVKSGIATTNLTKILNSSLDVICAVDAHGCFLHVSAACETVWGYTQEELIGKPFLDFVYPGDHEKTKIEDARIMSGDNRIHFQNRYIKKDGSIVTMTWSARWDAKDQITYGVARDATEMLLAEKKIRQSERSLARAQAIAKVGSWETDLSTLEVTWSKETFRIFGLDPEHFHASHPSFLTFVHPDDRDKVQAAFTHSLNTRTDNGIIHRIVTPEGREKIVEECWRILYDDKRQPVKAVGTCQDITERMHAEENISDSEEKRILIMKAALDAIICIDRKGDISFWNPQAEQIFGWKENEVTGKKLSGLIIPEQYRQRHEDGMAHYLKTGHGPALNKLMELSAINSKGEEFPIELTIMPIKQGKEEFFCAFIRDISKRKKTEKELQDAYQEKNTILESIADSFFAIDKNWIVTYWNKEAEKMLQTPKTAIIGRNLWEVFPHFTGSGSYKKYHQALETNQSISFEDYFSLLDKWYEISVFPSSNGLSVYFKDITDRKRSEADIRKLYEEKNAVLESIDDGFFAVDKNSLVTYWNRRAEILLGEKRENIIGKNLHEFFTTPNSSVFYDNYQKATQEKSTVHFEGFSVRSNKWFEVSAYGSELGLSVYFKDITERKEYENKIKESNDRYDLVSKVTNDMVWDWDLVTGNVYRNKEGWRKIFRTGDKEMEDGTTNEWDKRIHPEDVKKVNSLIEEMQGSEKNLFEVECRILRDDGSYAHIHDRGNIVRNEQGKAVRLIGATQDITERKEAELQLAKSEFRFKSLVQNSSDIVSILDESAYYIYSSPAAKRILGYEDEYIIGKNAFAFIHPDDAIKIRLHFKLDSIDQQALSPYRFKNAQGEWRWLESKITDMRDNPEVRGFVFNSRDVTDRIIAEEEINKLSIIARETVNAVIITDPEGKTLWVNEGFTQITEYELEDVIGKKPGDVLQGKETNLAVVRFMRQKIANLEPFECDIINYSKTGRKYWLRIQCQPQFDAAGNLKSFFAIETDITKEKEAEQVLKASEERYRYLFDNNPACIFIWDINTLGILEVNKKALEQYGYTRTEFLSKTILDQGFPEYQEEIKTFISLAKADPYFNSVNMSKHLNKSGEKMYMNIATHRIQYKGKEAVLALASNETEKVFLERSLEAERNTKLKAITDAVITAQEHERQEIGRELHDNINQILASSRLYLGMVRTTITAAPDTTDTTDVIPYIKETDKLINTAIHEIRSLSHSMISPSLNESELIDALDHLIQVTGKASPLVIHLEAGDFNENIISDKLRLTIYRIVQEQLNNILKYASAKNAIVLLRHDNEKLLLSIKDDGVGFDATKKSTGVGLMNIKTRASLFDGDLTVISSPGNGCELKITFIN